MRAQARFTISLRSIKRKPVSRILPTTYYLQTRRDPTLLYQLYLRNTLVLSGGRYLYSTLSTLPCDWRPALLLQNYSVLYSIALSSSFSIVEGNLRFKPLQAFLRPYVPLTIPTVPRQFFRSPQQITDLQSTTTYDNTPSTPAVPAPTTTILYKPTNHIRSHRPTAHPYPLPTVELHNNLRPFYPPHLYGL